MRAARVALPMVPPMAAALFDDKMDAVDLGGGGWRVAGVGGVGWYVLKRVSREIGVSYEAGRLERGVEVCLPRSELAKPSSGARPL